MSEGAMKQNLYKILGIPQNASQSALDAAYTELLKKHKVRHDQGKQDTPNDLIIIKWAYDHLSNADKRAAYDLKLEAMPVKPRIVHPIPKVSSQSATASQTENEEAQTDTPPSQSDEVNQPPKEEHWSEREEDSVKEHSAFILGDGTHLTPEQYGFMAVKSAIDDTIKDAGEIVGNNETEFRRGIAAKAEGVHLHLIALQTAVLYVYAAKFLAVPREILSEIYQGINTGLNNLLINNDGSLVGKDRPEFLDTLERAFRLYGQSLSDELNERSNSSEYDGNFMNIGSTASLFSEAIARLCGVQAQLQASPIDKMLIEQIAAQNGIVYLLKLGDAKHITYNTSGSQPNPFNRHANSSNTPHPDVIPGHKPLTLWKKIILAIFVIWLLLGLINIIFGKLV